MATLYDLTTYDNVIAHLDEAEATETDRPLIESMITGVSRLAETTMRRKIIARIHRWENLPGELPVADSYPILYGNGERSMFFDYPIISVDLLEVDGVTKVEGTDFHVEADSGMIKLISGRFTKNEPIRALIFAGYLTEAQAGSGTNPTLRSMYGWPEAAQDIQLSVTQQVAEFYRRRTRQREGLQSVSYEAQTFSYMTDDVLPEVLNVWLRHQRGHAY